ncbi:MAG: rod-binding protein [Neomegalonema sp.]|nr:rod-binding protein [Neomegalonema sp.]
MFYLPSSSITARGTMTDASAAIAPAAASAIFSAKTAPTSDTDAALRKVSKEFEVAFVAEMLKAAKLGEVKGPFTGGHGEEAFRSFLIREYATAVSEQKQLGIADKLYEKLKQKVAPHG